ncbi:MAG: hypothetical protein KDA86_09720 [Planctomycetaceae bacterium]|nr:hypothetical protein [Planctomycetaceae bacterium]
MRLHQSFPQQLLSSVVVLMTLSTLGGCAIWDTKDEQTVTANSPLKQVAPHFDAIELQVYYVERPIDDPLLGNSLWAELDQVSTLDPVVLTALRRNGFRFGVAGSDPPPNLQAALGMTGRTRSRTDDPDYQLSGHTHYLRSGQEQMTNTWPIYQLCQIELYEGGEQELATYESAQCVFRVTPERLQDGWVRVEFVPEVHYGENKMRHQAGDHQFELRPSQLIDPFYDQRFSVELNVGELVVLSAGGDNPESLGHHFFRGGNSGSKMQRLLIVKVADMKRLDPVYE